MNKNFLSILFFLAVLIAFMGCAGRDTVPGIDKRGIELPPLPQRDSVDQQTYNNYVNGTILEAMGDIPGANRLYAEALKSFPNSNEIRYSYAETFFQMNDFRHALEEADKIHPRDVNEWLLMADSYRALNINDSALSCYLQAVKSDSDNAGAFHYIAAYYQQANKLDSAIWAYENVARISPNYRVFQEIANLQMRNGNMDGALQNFLQAISLDSSANNVRSYLGVSVILEEKGDRKQAKQYLETAALLSPQNALIETRLLGFYEDDNDINNAIKTARALIPLTPGDKNIIRRLGVIYFNADSLHQADSIFTALINEGDDNIINHFYHARIAYLNKSYREAETSFTKVTEMADSVSDGWLNLGLVYHDMDSIGREIATYEKAMGHMKNIDDSVRVLFVLGSTLENQNNHQRAVEVFDQILRIKPDHSPTLNYLGYLLAERGERLEYARDLILRALKIQPENGAYLDSYGWVLYKMGDYKKALEELLKAYQYMNNDPTILEHVGDAYKATGDSSSAMIYWKKAFDIDTTNQSLKEKIKK